MKKFLLVLGLFVLAQTQIIAQTATNTLSATVIDNASKEKLEFVSVRALHASDSTFVNGASTNENGRFTLSLKPAKYIVKASFLGFQDYYINVNLTKNTTLNDIFLKEDAVMLSEAIVETKAIEVVVKGDTVEYNASSYKVQESAVVEDLLRKIQGVEIDENGTIKVNGSEVKKILVDGKEFFSNDPKVASKNLPAAMIEKLQVLDQKSDMALMTGFDDGNEQTVINLTIKPGMKEGVFGNALAGYGSEDRYETNAMVNYMRNSTQVSVLGGVNNTNNAGMSDLSSAMFGNSGGSGRPRGLRFGGNNGVTKSITGGFNFATEHSDKLKWGGDVRYGNNDNDVTSYKFEQFTSAKNPGTATSDTWGNSKSQTFATNLKFEWTPDSLTKIIFSPRVEYNTSDQYERSLGATEYAEGSSFFDKNNSSEQNYISEGSGYKLNGTLDMSRKLNSKGRVLSLGLSGGYSNADSEGFDFNHIKYTDAAKADSIIDLNFFQDDKSYNMRAFASFVEPLGRNNFLELSYNISKRNSETDKRAYTNYNLPNLDLEPEYFITDTANTRYIQNDFVNQNVSLKFRAQRQRTNGHTYTYMLGVGLEPSSSKTTLGTTELPDVYLPRKSYLSFAPSGQFTYYWDRRHNLRIDYNGTTNEPTTLQLYDGVYSRNGLNTTSGNSNLKPSFQNSLRIRYRNSSAEQGSFMALMGNFTHTSNAIVSTSATYDNGGRATSFANVDGNMNGSLRFIVNRPFRNRNWSVNSMTYTAYDISNTLLDGDKNKAKILTLQQNAGLRFNATGLRTLLLNDVDFTLRGNIRFDDSNNTINKNNNQSTFQYGGTFDMSIFLPHNFSVESDINYATNSGYSGGFKQEEWLWNAAVSKQIFKNKAGTVRFKIYDILKQRSNISRSITALSDTYTRTNTLSSYFMVHFVYRFQIFKGGAKMGDMNGGGERGMGRGPGGGGRPH